MTEEATNIQQIQAAKPEQASAATAALSESKPSAPQVEQKAAPEQSAKKKAKKPAKKKAKPKSYKTINKTENIMKQNTAKMDKITNEAAALSQESFEAFVKSGSLFAKGLEDIMRTSVSLAQNSAEKQSQFLKAALSSKTINEWAEAQNKIAQTNFDDFMAGATKISEMSVKVLNDCAEPLNEQLTKSMKKASESIAA